MHHAVHATQARLAAPLRLLRSFIAIVLLAAALPATAADRTPPEMRLGDDVKPTAYALTLRIDPRTEPFTGRVAIDVDLARPLDFFWVHGTRLAVTRAVLETSAGEIAATASAAGEDFIGVQLQRQAPAGLAVLRMEFNGRLSSTASRGLFRQQDLGEWYAFSQFEATNARRAFPSFDEPHWKTPWTLTLEVPRGDKAVSNTPEAARTTVDAQWDAVRFATTRPLPSYLVALGVGPFEIVDGGRAGRQQTPLRYVVPKGRAGEVGFAREATPRLLAMLEDYFGIAYPFEKLDSMAIPITLSFGAMENPGLITYRANFLIAPAEREDDRFRQTYASIGAHEMAHQWFGDLVTMRWWDDIWLNESFATWMADKIRSSFDPAWESGLRREASRQEAFEADRLPSTRQVRQPVRTRDDLATAFDRITYSKGGALLRMYEQRVGEVAFRDGVRRYLAQHAYGNATAEDFFAAIGATDPAVARSFSGFVHQPGLPLVDVQLDCDAHVPLLRLRQQRFLPGLRETTPQAWELPVCVRTDAGESCTLLKEQRGTMAPPGRLSNCPAWVLPNPAGTGYYLTRLQPGALAKLAAAPLQPLEAVALVREQTYLAASGAVPLDELLPLLAALARDPRAQVLAAVAEAAHSLHPALFTPPQRAQWPAWVREHFGAAARHIGWLPRDSDTDADRKLRLALLPLVTLEGQDPELSGQARQLARAWLGGDRKALRGQWREPLHAAARAGDDAFVDQVLGVLRDTRELKVREDLWGTLAYLPDDRLLARAFDAALAPGVDLRESMELFSEAAWQPQAAPAVLRFFAAHQAELAQRVPDEMQGRFPSLHANVCTPQERAEVARLYGPGSPTVPGRPRRLALALEEIDVCLRARGAH
ncbi:M1 family metallopeptidase [Ramlibacter algicola]|uniref:Aminopeptidase n=1 Tax=Ramlibacter algicola TaxID=2795217 RepID=A0A934PZ24_9BURK|nr:M1 family metallopeptidase [Ramlibacter algicola]MBK0392023.1 M1 family metallopeptidase [Ramlibacter algicola]